MAKSILASVTQPNLDKIMLSYKTKLLLNPKTCKESLSLATQPSQRKYKTIKIKPKLIEMSKKLKLMIHKTLIRQNKLKKGTMLI